MGYSRHLKAKIGLKIIDKNRFFQIKWVQIEIMPEFKKSFTKKI